jgi:hypothetical protein
LEFQWDDWNGSNDFNVSLWVSPDTRRPLSKKERQRWCDHIMKTGKPWADHTILNKQDARKIAEFILKTLDEYDKKEKETRVNNRRTGGNPVGSGIGK